jgi:dephospho-CoA kinase
MGCGKSTAAGLLAEAGFLRIDSDALVKNHVLVLPEVCADLRAHFGPDIFNHDGTVDRGRLAERIFANESDRLWLEDLTHPRVFDYWRGQLGAAPRANWVIEVPLLFEKQLENWFDFIVCVACAPEQQLARLEQRGLPGPLAEQRISKQLPLAHKIEHSDFVLWNDGSVAFLRSQVDVLIAALPKSA